MRFLLLTAVLLATACRRAPAPGAAIEYRAPDGSFTAKLPSNWKADEAPGETRKAAFFGPPDGAEPYSQMMGVYFHAAAKPEGPLDSTAETVQPNPHGGSETVITRTVAVPAAGGYFTLVQMYPAGSEPSASFAELVSTFKPAKP